MDEKRFNFLNNIIGWVVFIIAAAVYLSTIEPTVNLWDCGEFIAGSYKLEVVHPPGAPFFLMLHRFFLLFAPNPEAVPVIMNAASAIFSAFTILFLFWSISLLARKIMVKNLKSISQGEYISVFAASIVGALAFTFSDSFWFSAVEGEVYALSAFFTASVFWLILKWERRADQPRNLRWFILIFFLAGISIGVHLLSLLVIPVLALVYYFRKYEKITARGVIVAFLVGMLILMVINVGIIKWIPAIASKFEILFVNSLGLPYWSGVIFTLILIFGGLAYGIYRTTIKGKVILNTIFISLVVVSLGFSSYTMVAIRSNANTPIDYSNPDNIFNMQGYINREQYGQRAIFYGPQFTSDIEGSAEGRKLYTKKNGKYEFLMYKRKATYKSEDKMFFPRMSDTRGDRLDAYRTWSGMTKEQKKPTMANNLKYFFKYQLGHMYWRYFAWNFIGRQNDYQGHGSAVASGFLHGNWLSGIDFIDEKIVGSQEKILYKQKINKANNKLYFLPFIFGLLGLFFHFKQNKKDAITVFSFFLLTGIFLIIYQNSPPFEPRERDYTLVGSFYAFSIWIGIGVLSIINYLRKKMQLVPAAIVVGIISLLAVPVLMASQEYNDHDRSGRFTSKDYGVNYLESCAPNAILFTNGDNDTYPLWYVQEVEGIRSDVRVINLQLLMTDWYVDQLRRQQNESPPIKFSLSPDKIPEGTRDYVVYYENPQFKIDKKRYYNIGEIVDFIGSDNPRTKVSTYSGAKLDYYPTKKFFIPVDKNYVLKNNVVREELKNRIVDSVSFNVGKSNMMKNSLMVLDMIAQNNWERPIYFAITSGMDTYLGLHNYFQQEGMTYRLVPIKRTKQEKKSASRGQQGRVDPVIMYDNIMNKFEWGNLEDPDVYIGSVTRRHCTNYRNVFATLGKELISIGEKEKVVKLLDKCLIVLPEYQVPYTINDVQIAELYFLADEKEKGQELAERLAELFANNLDYFATLSKELQSSADDDIRRNFYGLQVLVQLAQRFSLDEFQENVTNEFQRLQAKYTL